MGDRAWNLAAKSESVAVRRRQAYSRRQHIERGWKWLPERPLGGASRPGLGCDLADRARRPRGRDGAARRFAARGQRPRAGPAAGLRHPGGHRAQAGRTRPVGADLDQRLRPGRPRPAGDQEPGRPQIHRAVRLHRALDLPAGHPEHHHPGPAQFRKHRPRRSMSTGSICAARRPDRGPVRTSTRCRCSKARKAPWSAATPPAAPSSTRPPADGRIRRLPPADRRRLRPARAGRP